MLPAWLKGGLGYFKERYHLVVEGPGLRHVLRAPLWNFYADPFPLEEDGRRCLLFEEFEGLKNKGRICAVCLETGRIEPVLERDYHLSYPYLFRHGEHWWMVPESHGNGTLDLYRCESFPFGWRRVCCLMEGVEAVDTNLVFRQDRVWLVTSLGAGQGQQHLALFSRPELMSGEWQAHPVNASLLYRGSPNLGGRNAGPIFRVGERLLRPTQYNPRYYGESMVLNEIIQWDEERYEERPWSWVHYPRRSGTCHHLCLDGEHMVYDLRAVYPYPWLRFPRSTPGPVGTPGGGWAQLRRLVNSDAV